MEQINKSNLEFLLNLKANNNRDWFIDHKNEYQQAHNNIISFADEVVKLMKNHDNIENKDGKSTLFRIYKDTRFSKDKTPYKTHWGSHLKRATKALRGGYYFHVEPGNSFVGGGFWDPNPQDLQRIREEIAADASELRSIINSKIFKDTFGTLQGEQLKTAPKGFPKDHPDIDLLRYKQFLISKKFTDKEVVSADFAKKVVETFVAFRPFFDYMSMVLTTDANGESIL